MPAFTKKDDQLGIIRVNTDNPAEIAELKANGFREDKPKQSQQSQSSSSDKSKK